MNIPSRVTLCEVGLRDGLQNEKTMLSFDDKLRLANDIIASGCRVLELGSFVSPKAVPQMADTDALFNAISDIRNLELRALIANPKGVERAIACGCTKVKLNVSASRAHNIANLNMSPQESVAKFKDCCTMARDNGIEASGSISMPFGSPWEKDIPLADVLDIIEAYVNVGVEEISLSDTSGMAVPNQVYELCALVQAKYPNVSWWLHLHNTRGVAMASFLAAMQAGITRFDTSLAGLGGCPFVPGAAGNIPTEDVVHMLQEMGVDTGIDIHKTLNTARLLKALVGHETDSYLLRAGCSRDLDLELPVRQTRPVTAK